MTDLLPESQVGKSGADSMNRDVACWVVVGRGTVQIGP